MNQVPYSDDFEKALLVGLLIDPSLIPRVASILEEKDFYKEAHQEIFKIINSVNLNSVDSLTVQDKLSEPTREYFIDLVKHTDSYLPSLTNIIIYAETIKDKSKLRAGIDLGREIIATCYQINVPATEALQKLEGLFANFLQNRVVDDKSGNTKEAFREFLPTLGQNLEDMGTQTGFWTIDSIIGRLDGLVILAARPSLGKTALAANIGRNIAATGKPVVMFSLEQTKKALFERLLAAEAEVNSEELRTGAFEAEDYIVDKVEIAAKKLLEIFENFHIDETAGVSTQYITSVSRQKKLEYGELGLIIVDYLHIMNIGDNNKVDALGDACRQLRDLGKELNTPILLLSQLSRQPDQYNDKDQTKRHRRPELTDLRSSGEIEQTADIVMFLYRESYQDMFSQPAEDIVEVLVRKNRQGRIGIGTLKWIPRFTKFEDLQ